MHYFFYILLNNVLPLSIMILIGVVMYKAFKIDIKTLSKLNFFVFSPVLVFVKLYESNLSFNILMQILLFFVIFFAIMFIIVQIVLTMRRYSLSMKNAMRNSVLFYNSANYAIPLNQMVFVGDAYTMSIQIIIMMMQSLLPNTYGVYAINAHKGKLKDILREIMILPVIYAIPLAFILRGFEIPIPNAIDIPLQYIANGFMATALLTLGVQLGSMKWTMRFGDVILSSFLRLCIGPAIGYLVVWMLGLEGLTAQALILSCAVPTSLSSVLIAVEYDSEPEFASQAVFLSTVLSTFTVSVVIYLLQWV